MYLIDKLIANKERLLKENKAYPALFETLKRVTPIYAQGVAEYFFQSKQEVWEWKKDFPNVAPPMPKMWIEYETTPTMNSEGTTLPMMNGIQLGCLIQSFDMKNEQSRAEYFSKSPDGDPEKKQQPISSGDLLKNILSHQEKPRWISNAVLFCSHPHRDDVMVMLFVLYFIAEDGSLLEIDRGGEKTCFVMAMQSDMAEKVSGTPEATTVYMDIPLLALSFMHCKNISTEPHRIPDERLQRRRIKDGKAPLTKMYTLNILPMKEVLKRENGGVESLSPRALHICRGHFKDFRDGRGLFGKYKGMYWWPMHAKGNTAGGEVIKSYSVNAPPSPHN